MMRKSRMRITIMFLLLIAGGAIVNVAVAWGCVCRNALQDPMAQFLDPGVNYVCHYDPLSSLSFDFGTMSTWRTSQAMGVTWGIGTEYLGKAEYDKRLPWCSALKGGIAANDASREYGGDVYVTSIREFAAGWPWFSFRSARMSQGFAGPHTNVGWLEFPLKDAKGHPVRVPTLPFWPGFAVNTILYAGVLWMIFAFPFVLRRRRRIKRGLCPACAYPVGTSPVCTECGMPVKNRETQKAETA